MLQAVWWASSRAGFIYDKVADPKEAEVFVGKYLVSEITPYFARKGEASYPKKEEGKTQKTAHWSCTMSGYAGKVQ